MREAALRKVAEADQLMARASAGAEAERIPKAVEAVGNQGATDTGFRGLA
jgi:hypothetical protein